MKRRQFVVRGAAGLSAAVVWACSGKPAPAAAERPWPGPRTPRSYVTAPPPPVGERLTLSDREWRQRLTRAQYEILRVQRTEPAFSCPLTSEHRTGTFFCGGCGAPLFHSRDKFDSGTGWTSFVRPIEAGRVSERADDSHGMERVEARCARCDGHLGHVFRDGPPPSRLRYCINGTILDFHEERA
jgi:peptide-methionine (R)-S-oxide reductase